MAYSIIPPIIVILSLIGIILFLIRKAPQVAMLNDSRPAEPVQNRIYPGAVHGQKENRMKQRSLLFLEKLTRKLKVFFLKLENVFTSWNEKIRQKRRGPRPKDGKQGELDRIEEYLERYEKKESAAEETERNEMKIPVAVTVKRNRPMVSEKVVAQTRKAEVKDRLERILIERIAANPKDTEAYERLGEYYFEIENYNHAKECFKQVIKLNPANLEVKNRMRKLERLLAR